MLALDVTKNFSYNKNVTFIVGVYSAQNKLKAAYTKSAYGSDLTEGANSVSMDFNLGDFNKDSDKIKAFVWTSFN